MSPWMGNSRRRATSSCQTSKPRTVLRLRSPWVKLVAGVAEGAGLMTVPPGWPKARGRSRWAGRGRRWDAG